MAVGDLLVDRLVAGGFLRPAVLLRGLQLLRPALSRWRVSLVMGLRWPEAQAPVQARIAKPAATPLIQ